MLEYDENMCLYYLSLVALSWVYFRFHLNVSDGCHNLLQDAMNFNDAAVVSVKGND